MKRTAALLLSVCMGLTVIGCSAEPEQSEKTITVLAAASLTDVMGEIESSYETSHPGVDLVFSFAGSGALQAQIEEGAQADVFISASGTQMDALIEEGLMNESSVRDLLINRVVLIVPDGSDIALDSFEGVTSDEVTMIGLGETESVPAGKYAEQIFTSLGIWDEVSAKANFGSDVRTVLQWVESGEVSCGVVYATDAYSSDSVTIVAEAPDGTHDPVVYPAGIIGSSSLTDESEEFLSYLESEDAASIFEAYGFAMAGS